MTQHINLLSRRKASKDWSWLAIRGLVALLLALTGMALSTEWKLRELREAEAKAQQAVSEIKVALEKKRRDAGLEQSEAMARQMTLLQAQVDAKREWADLLQKGELGNPSGYSQLMETLAAVHVDGVWLQDVDMAKGGQALTIVGKSLSGEAVMRYIGQINDAFKPMGVQFSSVEITQESADAAALSKAGILKFRIY